jgi:hypothetical protein
VYWRRLAGLGVLGYGVFSAPGQEFTSPAGDPHSARSDYAENGRCSCSLSERAPELRSKTDATSGIASRRFPCSHLRGNAPASAASVDVSTTRRIPHVAAAAELATLCRGDIRGKGNDMVESSAVSRIWRTGVGTAEKISPTCFCLLAEDLLRIRQPAQRFRSAAAASSAAPRTPWDPSAGLQGRSGSYFRWRLRAAPGK